MFRTFDADKPTADTYLKLEKDGNSVILRVVNAGGKNVPKGILMSFLPNGTYRRNYYVSKDVGIELDVDERIQEVG